MASCSNWNEGNNSGTCCPYHPGAVLIDDDGAGDRICSECGLVVGERMIDVSNEWRTFTHKLDIIPEDDPSRVGPVEDDLLYGSGLGTYIGPSPSSGSKYFNRPKLSKSDRILSEGFKELDDMSERIKVPRSVVYQAKRLFKAVQEHKNFTGRNNDGIAPACLFIACRQEKVPRTFKEIYAVTETDKKTVAKTFKAIITTFHSVSSDASSTDYITRFATNLRLPVDVQQNAIHICRKTLTMSIAAGSSPTTIAAAAIYMAAQKGTIRNSMKIIAEVTGVSSNTIGRTVQLMRPYEADLFPKDRA